MKYNSNSLKNLVSFTSKGIAPKYAKSDDDNSILVLNQKCNRDGKISLKNARYNNLSKRKVSKEKILNDKDILINSTGVGTAGRIAQIRKDQLINPITVDSHMIILRPSKNINPDYLGYALKAKQKLVESYAEGSTGQTEINRQRLLDDTVIRYPSIGEQEKIANIFLNLDRKIEKNNQINDNLLELAKTIFKNIIKTSSLHALTINDVGTVIGGGTPSKKVPKYWNGNIPWISPKDLSNHPNVFTSHGENSITQNGLDHSSTKILPKKTVLFSSRAPIGYISIANNEITTNQGFKSVIPNKNYPFWFIYELLKSETPKIINEANGSTFKEISGGKLKQHKICIPTSIEVIKYNSIFLPIFEKIQQSEKEIDKLNQIKDILLNKFF
ncbi:hypothetical protein CBF58_06215 [Lactobacillus taiwanensis]|uniref:Type I restriction modification DNA specificity domain-containing protein n=1 Tax=Lactobacillus taiwanensis TaxID=508451 RepID=A0ABX4ERF6_9LACO|nr:restriction endonuclease subunit S [Lactobacillus taiwanensis]OYR88609.1 hypothetical protein CBF53_02690 [Lactobacillus taiwanensis]OYR95807.1 hypothetical protein CBF58_06215 [Lactobacillus taiwanensis]